MRVQCSLCAVVTLTVSHFMFVAQNHSEMDILVEGLISLKDTTQHASFGDKIDRYSTSHITSYCTSYTICHPHLLYMQCSLIAVEVSRECMCVD